MSVRGNQKIDQKSGRAINRQMILNLVRRTGGMSRSELSSETGLSAAAVGFVVKELLESGYLIEEQPRDSRSGRRPVPLRLNHEGHLAIGLKLGLHRLDCILTDMAMQPLDQQSTPLTSHEPEVVVEAARVAVSTVLARRKGRPQRPILGVGWSMPGRLAVEQGLCIRSLRFKWADVPIGPMLSEALGLPVFIEDDTLAYGLAHYLFGLGQQQEVFSVLAVGEGLFYATVIAGQVWRGHLGNAGKVGHIVHAEEGQVCECGRVGCLQTHFSVTALERRWLEVEAGPPLARGVEAGPPLARGPVRRSGSKGREGLRPQSLQEAVAAGDERALALVGDAGAVLGRYLAGWVTVTDPEHIILGGESVAFGDAFVEPMQRALDRYYYREQGPKIIRDGTSFYWTAGAAATVMRHIFDQ